jgi:hypothetical protein
MDIVRHKTRTSILNQPTGAGRLEYTPVPIHPVTIFISLSSHTLLTFLSCTSEILVIIYQTVQCHIAKNYNFYDVVAAQSFLETIETRFKI